MTFDWLAVADVLRCKVADEERIPADSQTLDAGQRASLLWIARRIPESGLVLADEVGTGKTRIACALIQAVVESGGRAAVVVPHGLMHQWIAEAMMLAPDGPEPKALTTLTDFLRDVQPGDAAWNERKPYPNRAEWWLISHGFRAPRVQINSRDWRAALPGLVELNLARPAERTDKRTRLGRLQQAMDEAPDSWWAGMVRIAGDVAGRLPSLPELRNEIKKRIRRLPPLSVMGADPNYGLRAAFGDGGDGRPLTEKILGLWLGDFDLMVIDEAHKGRSDFDVDNIALGVANGTVLGRLADVLLTQPGAGRRLCLTATPMELGLDQWLDLLKRARVEPERGREVINAFREAARNAGIAPDERHATGGIVRGRPRIHPDACSLCHASPARRGRTRRRIPSGGGVAGRAATSLSAHSESPDRLDAIGRARFPLGGRALRRGGDEPQRPRAVLLRH